MKPQGRMAGFTGGLEERKAMEYLQSLGYCEVVEKEKKHLRNWAISGRDAPAWFRNHSKHDAVYARHAPTIKNIYGIEWNIDLTIWHRTIWPQCLFVEIKSQTSSGSCDSKIPYVVLGLKQQQGPTGLLLVGNGYARGLVPWLEGQQNEKFLIWRNALRMRDYVETGKFTPSNIAPVGKTVIKKVQGDLYEQREDSP